MLLYNATMFVAIAAVDIKNGIGKDGKIPWKNKEDMRYFKNITTLIPESKNYKINVVVMGRITWESLGRPLKNRLNIVLSTQYDKTDINLSSNVLFFENLTSLLIFLKKNKKMFYKYFVIGGAKIYNLFYRRGLIDSCIITRINENYKCDVFFPDCYFKQNRYNTHYSIEPLGYLPDNSGIITKYKYINNGEIDYFKLLEKIILDGEKRKDRTGVGTIGIFNADLVFDLAENKIPLLTTKRMFFRGIVEELLWMLRGDTNVNYLKERDIHIWDENTSREFLDNRGLTHYEEGDLGASYSHQFRHFAADYRTMRDEYSGKGFDQVKYVLNELKYNPYSRRIVISLWCPSQFDKMAIPPCVYSYQFYVSADRQFLDCKMIARSSDAFLGLPWNFAFSGIMTQLFAKMCGYNARKLYVSCGDTHIYTNHTDAIKEQLRRIPSLFPQIQIKVKPEIEDYTFEDFTLLCYDPLPTIRAQMAI